VRYRVELEGDVQQQGEWIVPAAEKEQAGRLLAYRLFGIVKTTLGTELPPLKPVKETEKAKESV
jgi:hypothetical protein